MLAVFWLLSEFTDVRWQIGRFVKNVGNLSCFFFFFWNIGSLRETCLDFVTRRLFFLQFTSRKTFIINHNFEILPNYKKVDLLIVLAYGLAHLQVMHKCISRCIWIANRISNKKLVFWKLAVPRLTLVMHYYSFICVLFKGKLYTNFSIQSGSTKSMYFALPFLFL